MSLIDQPRDVRDEDALDLGAVNAFLRANGVDVRGAPELKQYRGGASNLTYLLRYEGRDLILRRPPAGRKAKSAHDMVREAKIMATLAPVYPFVPKIVAVCEGDDVLGAPFYVMERLEGVILRQDIPSALGLDEGGVRALCTRVIDTLAALHAIDVRDESLSWIGKGEGYVTRQVVGWSERWRAALTDDVDPIEDVLAWLEANKPACETRICLIHNDFRFDNIVLDPDDPLRVIGVLDWEMATLGDPLMDLGGSLAYWVEASDDPVFQMMRRQPTNAPGMLTRTEVIGAYAAKTGVEIGSFAFYEIFGLFRLAGIIQQIWWRFRAGQTTNPAFATFGTASNYLGSRCRRLIEESR
jgi:aminoglycoside phosphotransferase (APT) family kinase protein